ncbi:MAG: hypothetical protein ACTSWP_07595 [Candidatus Freyarchaeota archaeon]|nr:hypothetical protein [Candidatus Freyrarchaeum guaymaensis]
MAEELNPGLKPLSRVEEGELVFEGDGRLRLPLGGVEADARVQPGKS